MRVLLDACVPKGLRRSVTGHDVRTAHEMGWGDLDNGDLLDAVTQVLHTVEPAVELQVLAHRQAVRQVDIGRREIHPRQRRIAPPQHVDAEDLYPAAGRLQQPEQHGDGRGLARTVAAKQSQHGTARRREAQIVDGDDLAIHLAQVLDHDGGRFGHAGITTP